MKVSYYPGCSLEATARDYEESIRGVAAALDIELVEVPDWNCCGATAAHSLDHRVALNLGARNLAKAASGPQPTVVPCALCFNRLKTSQAELMEDAGQVTDDIRALGADYSAVDVVELNSFLTSPRFVALAQKRQQVDISGLRPVCYYGCQGNRPPKITGRADYEQPQGIDRLLGELGVEVKDWSFRTDCCGASHSVARPDIVFRLVGNLYVRALEVGANCVVTGCQMCQANLDLYQSEIAKELGREIYLPVLYFTEVIGLALGEKKASRWLGRHMVGAKELLKEAHLPQESWERL